MLTNDVVKDNDQVIELALSSGSMLRSNARLWMTCVLICMDMLSLLGSILIALQIKRISGLGLDAYYFGIFILLAITIVFAFLRNGLYPAVGLKYEDELRGIVSSTNFSFLILIGVTFVLKTSTTYSRLILLVLWVLSLILIPTGRYLIRRICIRLNLWGESVAIIGELSLTSPLVEYFKANLQLGLQPVAVLNDEYFSNPNSENDPTLSIQQIKEYSLKASLNTVLIVIKNLNYMDELVARYRFVFHRVIFVMSPNGNYSLYNLKTYNYAEFLALQVKNNLLNNWSQLIKRIVDIFVSFLGLVLLAPFFGLTALIVKIGSPGGAFYHQLRIGKHNEPFHLIKFRTMYQNADLILADYLAKDPVMKQEWELYQKIKKDPRLTPIGRILRKLSLDELPQLWNVLIGEMSLVGPRPIMVDQRMLYGDSFQVYIQVTPGITGLWQVSGRNFTSFARRAELDNEYILRWSVWLDIFIFFKTFKVTIWQRGAY